MSSTPTACFVTLKQEAVIPSGEDWGNPHEGGKSVLGFGCVGLETELVVKDQGRSIPLKGTEQGKGRGRWREQGWRCKQT